MYQQLSVIGNLGRDPELKFMPDGKAVTSLSVASNRKYTNNGQQVKETTWFNVGVFGTMAEHCNNFLHKGSRVMVVGRLNPDKETGSPKVWESNGRHGASYDVIAERVVFLSFDQQDQGEQEESQVPF